jgi:hypothetical protein
VDSGESIRGLFPLAEERRGEYEAWREARPADTGLVHETMESE